MSLHALQKVAYVFAHADEDLLDILENLDPSKEISIGKSIYKKLLEKA